MPATIIDGKAIAETIRAEIRADAAAVRTRLAVENPHAATAVQNVLIEVVGGIQSETRKVSDVYAHAREEVMALKRSGQLGEGEVYRYARESSFEQTVVALSILCNIEIDAVEQALQDRGHDLTLILAKVAGFSSTGAKALLLLKTADRGISTQDLDIALKNYDKLQLESAERVLGFHRARIKSAS